MMQDNNTVSLLVDAVKTHVKVAYFLKYTTSYLSSMTCYVWIFLGRKCCKERLHGVSQYCRS